jgi:signal transduction histidine kinase
MLAAMSSGRRTPGAGILGPINLAAYLAWLAVALSPLMLQATNALPPAPLVGLVAQLAFLGLFVLRAVLEERDALDWRAFAAVVAQAVAALIAVWATDDRMQGVLLVLVASQLAIVTSPRIAAAVLLPINAALAILVAQTLPGAKAAQVTIAFMAFQAFAALVTAYAYRAHRAHETALRINAELLATRQLLEEGARAEERLRVSRELHDVVGNKLTGLKLQLMLQSRGADGGEHTRLDQCLRLTDELLTDIRGVVTTLRQHDGVDLHRALRALDPDLPRPRVSFDLDAEVRVADMHQAEALLRCAQEGLGNALRHSGAAEIRIALARGPEGLTLTIEDDGRGRTAAIRPGNGLRGMRERLQEFGGNLLIEDRSPAGLSLRAVLPAAHARLS